MLLGEKVTRLQLTCLMFSAFKAFEPTLDIGIDLKEEYNIAVKLVAGS
jgi:hypothetical protein